MKRGKALTSVFASSIPATSLKVVSLPVLGFAGSMIVNLALVIEPIDPDI